MFQKAKRKLDEDAKSPQLKKVCYNEESNTFNFLNCIEYER